MVHSQGHKHKHEPASYGVLIAMCDNKASRRETVSRLNPSTLSRTPFQQKQNKICAKHDALRVIERTHESHDSRVELSDSAADHSL
jgi:hypothetical protein